MSKKVKWAIFLCVMIVLSGVYSVIDKNNAIYDKSVDNEEYKAVRLMEHDTLQQSFYVKEERLDGVNIKMSGSGDVKNASVVFVLTDENGQKVVEGSQTLDQYKPGKFFSLKFDPITGCREKEYTFALTVERCGEDTEVLVYSVPEERSDTGLMVRGEAEEETLALRTITHRFDLETFLVTLVFLMYVVLFMRWLVKIFK